MGKLGHTSWWLPIYFAGILAVYYASRQTLVTGYADSTELVLAAQAFGLAHPPGYAPIMLILGSVIRIFSVWTPMMVANTLVAVVSAANATILLILLRRIFDKQFGRRQAIWGSLGGSLIFAGANFTFIHATVFEVFPFVQFLSLLAMLTGFDYLTTRKPWKLGGTFFLISLAVWTHPLSLALWLPFLGYGLTRIAGETDFSMGKMIAGGWLGGFLLAYGTYLFLSMRTTGWYQWPSSPNLAGFFRFWLRLDYTAEGSAIESLTHQWSIHYLLYAGWGFIRWVFYEFGAGALMGIVGFIWLWRRFKREAFWILLTLFLTGLLPVLYMKLPMASQSVDTGYFWGTVLRFRMMYGFSLAFSVLAGLGALVTYGFKKYRFWWWGFCLVWLVFFGSRFSRMLQSRGNLQDTFYRQTLNSLPNGALVLVDNDAYFGFRYLIEAERVGPGVEIISSKLPFSYVHKTFRVAGGKDKLLFEIGEMVVGALDNGQRVFLMAPDPAVASFLGLEGNPYFGSVYGYFIEMTREPVVQLETYNYGISKQMAESQRGDADWWLNGFAGYLSELHSILVYYLTRSGFDRAAIEHKTLALDLAQLPTTKREVEQTYTSGRETYLVQGSYTSYIVPHIDEYLDKGDKALADGDQESAQYFYTRSWLLSPGYARAWEKLSMF